MELQGFKQFSPEDHQTWKLLFKKLAPVRAKTAHPIFAEGVKALAMTDDRIPDLNRLNERLLGYTGWQVTPVEGFEGPDVFYRLLAEKKFPVGNFIRDPGDLAYTPAPDIFHDLYGHVPFLVNPEFAEFCHLFGLSTARYFGQPEICRMYERLFWYGVEFPIIETSEGRKIFGGGILSSYKECEYSLSDGPKVLAFDAELIRDREFYIDRMQDTIFLLKNENQLYDCLEAFDSRSEEFYKELMAPPASESVPRAAVN